MRSALSIGIAITPWLVGLVACSPFDPELGDNPFTCGDEEPKCPQGYTCQDDPSNATRKVCVIEGGAIVDANTANFECSNDAHAALEGSSKNDTIMTAYQTPVALQESDIPYRGLGICPAGDKDLYAITIGVATQNIEIVVSWDDGLPVSASILQSSAVPIVNATSNGERSIKAYAANVPMGTYYAQVFGGAMTQNTYNLTITVTD